MKDSRLQEKPTINEIVGSIISICAVCTVMYLAVQGDDGSKTALITLTGAVAGMYYQNKVAQSSRQQRPPLQPTNGPKPTNTGVAE